MEEKGVFAAFILGLAFGVALGPCTFAFMGPVLAVAFTSANDSILFAACLLLAYGIGHCSVIVFAGTFTEKVQQYLNWNERSKGGGLGQTYLWFTRFGRRRLADIHQPLISSPEQISQQ